MTIIDWIIFGILIVYILTGFISGFIQTLGSLIGTLLGIYLSGRFYESLADFIAPLFWHNLVASQIFAFIIIFIVTSRLVGLAAHVIYKTVNVLPFTKIINRLLGVLLGLIEGSLFLGAVLFIYSKLDLTPQVADLFEKSSFVLFFLKIGKLISPLFPLALRQLQSLI